MRRRFLNIGGILLASMLLTNCNSDETTIINEPEEHGNGELTFVLPIGKKSSVTYADVQGIDSEYRISNLFIYWFKEDGPDYKLHKIFKYVGATGNNNIQLSGQPTAATNATMATIAVGDDHTPSRFYFVTNINGDTQNGVNAISPALDSLNSGMFIGIAASEFENKIAKVEVLEQHPDGNVIPSLGWAMPMSINKNGSTQLSGGYVSVSDPATGGLVSTEVHLKRRVARFDIINNKDYSNFEVTNVLISRAQQNGWIQDKPFDLSTNWPVGKVKTIWDYGNSGLGNGTRGSTADANNDGIPDDFQGANPTRDSLELNPALFYLWPTVLKPNDVTDPTEGTEILIEGIFNGGITRLYKLNLSNEIVIKANNIYRIRIGRVTENTLKFNLIVDHWDEADTLSTVPSSDDIDWASCTVEALDVNNPASFNNLSIKSQNYTYCSADTVTLKIEVKSNNLTSGANKYAANIEMRPDTSYKNLLSDQTATMQASNINAYTEITYAAQFKTTYYVKLPPTIAPTGIKLILTNPVDDSDHRTINLCSYNYNKMGYKPVLANQNTYWAPFNVGATRPGDPTKPLAPNDYDIIGKHFQWGRNVGWYGDVAAADMHNGPISPAEISMYADKFIMVNSPFNWLTPWDTSFWNSAVTQEPCPEGWHLPSSNDFNYLTSRNFNTATGYMEIQGNDSILYLPAAGCIFYSDGILYNVSINGYYWTRQSLTNGNTYIIQITSPTSVVPRKSAYAYSVRCVRYKD